MSPRDAERTQSLQLLNQGAHNSSFYLPLLQAINHLFHVIQRQSEVDELVFNTFKQYDKTSDPWIALEFLSFTSRGILLARSSALRRCSSTEIFNTYGPTTSMGQRSFVSSMGVFGMGFGMCFILSRARQ